LSDEDDVVALRLHHIDNLVDVGIQIGPRGRLVTQAGQGDRQGLVPVRSEQIRHLLVDPAALPTSGYQDENGHRDHP
jgi:hypothetical protein